MDTITVILITTTVLAPLGDNPQLPDRYSKQRSVEVIAPENLKPEACDALIKKLNKKFRRKDVIARAECITVEN